MKICFNQATTMKHSTLESDLEYCEKYHYDLIEIRLDKLRDYFQRHTPGELRTFFDTHHIKPFAFNALEFINFRDEAGFQEIMDGLKLCCSTGEIIGCKRTVIVPTFDIGNKTISEIREESVRVIRILSDYAELFGMKLAFEFVGYPNCSVNTFGQAYDIVTAADRPNVGVVLDCFHFHAMGSRFEDLESADGSKIFILHLDDSEDLPVGAARDNNRLMPGEGAVNLPRILSTLKRIGYDSMVSIELFRPEYWDWPDEENIRICYEKTCDTIRPYFPIG